MNRKNLDKAAALYGKGRQEIIMGKLHLGGNPATRFLQTRSP
jgi:hypothetical protein